MKNCSALSTFTSKCVILHCFYSRTTHRFLYCFILLKPFPSKLPWLVRTTFTLLLCSSICNQTVHSTIYPPAQDSQKTRFFLDVTQHQMLLAAIFESVVTRCAAQCGAKTHPGPKRNPDDLGPWDLGPFSNVKRESSTSNHQFSANISVFRGVCDENEWCSLKFHEWWVFQLHSMGFCEMKFWNDTQISGVIYFQNAQEFIWLQFYLANASWVATFHKGNYQKSTATFTDDL